SFPYMKIVDDAIQSNKELDIDTKRFIFKNTRYFNYDISQKIIFNRDFLQLCDEFIIALIDEISCGKISINLVESHIKLLKKYFKVYQYFLSDLTFKVIANKLLCHADPVIEIFMINSRFKSIFNHNLEYLVRTNKYNG